MLAVKKWKLVLITLMLAAVPSAGSVQAQGIPTKVKVRAVSQDAKVLHDGVGGARITIRDLSTGRLLAQGLQTGTSGDTDKIMRTPHERGDVVYDTEGTAAYVATLMLEWPTLVEITAEGPLSNPLATQRASKTMLLVPGRDVLGEGILLTIHGFIVTLLAPEETLVAVPGAALPVRATVTMSCGCPTEPGGLWDANGIDIVARLLQGERVVREVPLRYAGERSTYEGTLQVPADAGGGLGLEILAMDADNANFGRTYHALKMAGSHESSSR